MEMQMDDEEMCDDPTCLGCLMGSTIEVLLDRYPEEMVIQATMELLQDAMEARGHTLSFNLTEVSDEVLH